MGSSDRKLTIGKQPARPTHLIDLESGVWLFEHGPSKISETFRSHASFPSAMLKAKALSVKHGVAESDVIFSWSEINFGLLPDSPEYGKWGGPRFRICSLDECTTWQAIRQRVAVLNDQAEIKLATASAKPQKADPPWL